jgi:methionyl-tRNA formyltransferase
MRIVFLGTPAAAVPALDALVAAGHEIPLVVTRPDGASGRSRVLQAPPVKLRAAARGLAVIQPATVRDASFREKLAAVRPDALAVVAYGRILPPPILDLAPLGAINLHFSLLPAFRGAAPVAWALARGETETGATTFRLDQGLDTGPILLREAMPILAGEHAPALIARMAARGGELLVETLARLAAGTVVPVLQDDSLASLAPLLTRADGVWDPGWTAQDLEGRVRGFDPWPAVSALQGNRRIRIAEARAIADGRSGEPAGTLLGFEGPGLRIACAGGTSASILAVQPEGRRTMSAREAVNGRQLTVGDRLLRL